MNMKCLFILAIIFHYTPAVAEETLILGRAPQLSASKTSELWVPLTKYLSENSGINVSLKVYTERSAFEHDIQNASIDLYYGNPGYGVIGHIMHGYTPIIRSDKKMLEGIIVTKKSSGITQVQQLNNQIIAFPAKNAFAASRYIRSRLTSDFGITYQPVYIGTHDNTYRAVLLGKAVAGGGVKRTLEQEPPRLRDQLQIIYTTPGMRPHPLMAHPRVSKKSVKKIQQLILALKETEDGRKLLKLLKIRRPVIANYQKDYKPIEAFALSMYQSLLK